jgi:signal transduction histidine kinase
MEECMSESYSDGDARAVAHTRNVTRDMIGRLVPGADADLLLSALEAERAMSPAMSSGNGQADAEEDPSTRELHRVRRLYALGETARTAQHELNNPLTALLAEAQLLALEPITGEQRAAVERIVTLTRRIAAVARRFEGGRAPTIG